jgi:hypothetical protein
VFGWLSDLVERFDGARRRRILLLLAQRPMSEAELGRHFRLTVTLGWHLRELHALGLVAYNRRASRYHLIWSTLDELAAFCAELDDQPAPVAPVAGSQVGARASQCGQAVG